VDETGDDQVRKGMPGQTDKTIYLVFEALSTAGNLCTG
jgi:hypothetical protein